MIYNNELTRFGSKQNIPKDNKQKLPKVNPALKERLFRSEEGKAEIFISDIDTHILYEKNGLTVSNFGSLIDGPLHLGQVPSDIRISGFWVLNDKLLTGLPSTTYTPIPVLVYKEPKNVKYAAKFMKLLSGLGG